MSNAPSISSPPANRKAIADVLPRARLRLQAVTAMESRINRLSAIGDDPNNLTAANRQFPTLFRKQKPWPHRADR